VGGVEMLSENAGKMGLSTQAVTFGQTTANNDLRKAEEEMNAS
jgi:hypothetical protein